MLALAEVAEHQANRVSRTHPDTRELLGVSGELQQRGHPRRAGELGVLHFVESVAEVHDEIGETDESSIEERGLEDDVGPIGKRRLGRGRRGLERFDTHRRRSLDLHDTVAEPVDVGREHPRFVFVTELACPLQHRVRLLDERRDAPEFCIKRAEKPELAIGRVGQVGRAGYDCAVQQEHAAPPVRSGGSTLAEATDRPTSSRAGTPVCTIGHRRA